jgi:hypothetical protein
LKDLEGKLKKRSKGLKLNYMYGCSDVPWVRRATAVRQPRVPSAGAQADTNHAHAAVLVLALSD